MGQCAAQVFSNISSQKWLAMQTKAAGDNINLTGDTGQTTEQGFTFTWHYEAATEILTIQCLGHPFWATCGEVNSKVHHLIDGLG
jgi:hypothetical protein